MPRNVPTPAPPNPAIRYRQDWGEKGYDGVLAEGMVMRLEALAAPAQGREAVKLEEQVLITADGFEPLSSYPLEESWIQPWVVRLAHPPGELMRQILDLDRWPLDDLSGTAGQALVARCGDELREVGLFSLDALIQLDALETGVAEVAPVLDTVAFTHSRDHNIYFDDEIEGLEPNHPALRRFTTINHTICGDQIPGSLITRIYEWRPLIDFLAAAMRKSRLYPMEDPLGRINVMVYHEGEQLNWHFDRAEFTTTVLLQAPRSGGEFQYRSALRSESDPNYNGVARLLADQDERVQTLPLQPGTLNVFKGKNTAHRVTPVEGDRPRIVAVFSYYETAGFAFSNAERLGFYGRTLSTK